MSQRGNCASARKSCGAKGSFEDGVFSWAPEHGGRRKQDGYEAVWEYVNGKPVRYSGSYVFPIIMDPASFDYLPVRGASVEEKCLGRFNERGLEIKMMKVHAGASFDLKASERPLVVCAMSGEGYANGEPYGSPPSSKARRKRGPQSGPRNEFFIVGLPTFD
ncbi:MAG: hypothetical protein R3C55_05835 [Parvularculaceae bacterium]